MSRSRSSPVTSRSTSLPPCGLISFILFPSFVNCLVACSVRSPRVSKGNARSSHLLAATQQSAASCLGSRVLSHLALPHGRASDTPSLIFQMYSALSLNRSPPATRARVFTNLHGRGAGRAADGRVAVVVQRVIGYVIPGYVIPYVASGPGGERVDFDK